MTLGAWLAWSVLAVAVVIDMIAIVLEQRRVTRIFGEVDDLNAVVFGAADDINVREAIVDLQAYVGELAAFVTQQDDEQPTGRHAHSGGQQRDEIRRIATEALVATLTSVTNRGAYRA